ncbi:MAG: DegV family protein [Eubacteriaceae bacterium]|jgi:DegV family protein with EDD domain
MGIIFMTDSMCDLSSEIKSNYQIEILPIPISVGDKEYYDGVDISADKLLRMVDKNPGDFPKTAQVRPLTYKREFEKAAASGNDVICLTLSSGLSGTFQTASLIAEELSEKYPDRKIAVIDSLCATAGMAMILQQGLKLDRLHRDFDEICQSMRFLADHINIFFLVGDIKWLARGGRLSKSAATIGDMLKIVPILYFVDGKIQVFDKVRGKKKAFKRLIECTETKIAPDEEQIIGLIAPPVSEHRDKAVQMFEKKHRDWDYMIPGKGAGAALTVHIGGDYLGIVFFDELPDNYVPILP